MFIVPKWIFRLHGEKLELDIKEVKTDVIQDHGIRKKETSVQNWA